MIGRVVRFIATADAAMPAEPGVELIVLDASWTPMPGDRPDVRPVRPFVVDALRSHDPLTEAMRLLDRWAAASDMTARLEVDGFSLWYRRRLVFWRGLYDRLIWRWVLGSLADEGPLGGIELTTHVPELRDVAELLAARRGWGFSAPEPPPKPEAAAGRGSPSTVGSLLSRFGLRSGGRSASQGGAPTLAERSAEMVERVRTLGEESGRLLVLTAPSTHQAVQSGGATATQDPFLGSIVAALGGTPLEPVSLEIGTSLSDDETWTQLHEPGRERILPGSVVSQAFADPADDAPAEAARATVAERLAGEFATLDADGLDLAPWIVAGLRDYAAPGPGLATEVRQVARIRRFLQALRPAAILTINEYSRPEWLIAGIREGIPVVAVQHGIIHPLHAGYILPSRTGLPLATRTHLFGHYEARLLTEASVYRPDEVAVSGAPRLDLVPGAAMSSFDRTATRTSLGVGPAEQLVVLSSTNLVQIRSTMMAAAIDTILDRAWPNVHLVVKLHPAEEDDGFYPALIEGIGRERASRLRD